MQGVVVCVLKVRVETVCTRSIGLPDGKRSVAERVVRVVNSAIHEDSISVRK